MLYGIYKIKKNKIKNPKKKFPKKIPIQNKVFVASHKILIIIIIVLF